MRKALKDKLLLEGNFEIERCHWIKSANNNQRHSNQPRPIVAKFCKWQDKEAILRKARTLKPEGVKLFPDFAKRTLERRALQRGSLIAARAKGKVAYFVINKLVIEEGQSSFGRQFKGQADDSRKEKPPDSDAEMSFGLADAVFLLTQSTKFVVLILIHV